MIEYGIIVFMPESQETTGGGLSFIEQVRHFIAAQAESLSPGSTIPGDRIEGILCNEGQIVKHEDITYRRFTKLELRVDKAIRQVTNRFNKLEFMKLFGSPQMQVDFFIPIFDAQIREGRLTRENAIQFCQVIADGGMNLLTKDIAIGSAIGWASTKVLTFPLSVWLAKNGHSDLAAGLLILDNFTAVWEIPYFTLRALQEYRYYINRLKSADTQDPIKSSLLRKRLGFLAGAVLINILPQPICWFNGIVITFPRNTGITLVLMNHNLDIIEERYRRWEEYRKNLEPIGIKIS